MDLCSYKQSENDIQKIRSLVFRNKTLASIIDSETNEIFRFIVLSTGPSTFSLTIETLHEDRQIHDVYEDVSAYFCTKLTEYLIKAKLAGSGYIVYQDNSIQISAEKPNIPFEVFFEDLAAECAIETQLAYRSR